MKPKVNNHAVMDHTITTSCNQRDQRISIVYINQNCKKPDNDIVNILNCLELMGALSILYWL